MVFCQHCGIDIPDRVLFCRKCGQSQSISPTSGDAAAAVAPARIPALLKSPAPKINTGIVAYQYRRRPVEKIMAFAASLTAVCWFLWSNRDISNAAGTGLLFGVFAPFVVTMLGTSAVTEGWLLTGITILIGINYGLAGLGMSFLGFLIFSGFLVALLTVSNRLFFNADK